KVEQAYLDKRTMQYLYKEGDEYVVIDKETYQQISLVLYRVGELILYLKENDDAQVTFHDGKPISLEVPQTVQLTVTETEPALKEIGRASCRERVKMAGGLKIFVT